MFLRISSVFATLSMLGIWGTASAEVWTYDVPGGEAYSSPDYEVCVEWNGGQSKSFVHHSHGLGQYTLYHRSLEPAEVRPFRRRGLRAHSTAIFSFRGAITVRVTVKRDAKHITLPLRSAKILPSSYDIPCTVENGDTIVFTLERPEKVAVIPNYDQAMEIYRRKGAGHKPIQRWNSRFQEEALRDDYHGTELRSSLSEGFQNPLIVVALPPERAAPNRDSAETLLVHPGQEVTQAEIDEHQTVWFTPGVHDLSTMGAAPWHQTLVKRGQTVYLEGGSYVMARFKRNDALGSGPCAIRGRGVVSGIKHKWVRSFPEGSQLINIDHLNGITVTDRACFGIYGGQRIEDVTMVGAWHGNTDGPDYLDDCLIENCFLMAHDDNLKLNNRTHAKHLVIWQMANAHAIMVKEFRDNVVFADSIVEDVDVIAYFVDPSERQDRWAKIAAAAIACVTGSDLQVRNFTFRDIRIESPYLFRVFDFYNLDTNQEYSAPWFKPTSESRHTRIVGMTVQDVTVNSPVIGYRSLIGSGYPDSMSNLRFTNICINGTMVTEENKESFFEIEPEQSQNVTFTVELESTR